MSEKQDPNPLAPSNELVRWLQLLVLPLWARLGLLVIMGLIVAGGLTLLVAGLVLQEKEDLTAAMTLLTVALPVMLIVVALVFGQNGEKRLKDITRVLLEIELPLTLIANLSSSDARSTIKNTLQGCRCDYQLKLVGGNSATTISLDFSIELNVRKVNVAFWLNAPPLPDSVSIETEVLKPFRHVISGALSEGYKLNETPLHFFSAGKSNGLLFFRELDPDFLLKPAARLYFCQDMSFFVRGVVEAQHGNLGKPTDNFVGATV